MSLFQWEERFSVSNSDIDSDHKRLFELLASLHEAMSQGKGKSIIIRTVDELFDYSNYHFKKEEALLLKVNFHGLSEQKKAHSAFLQHVQEFRKKIDDGKEGFITVDVQNLLVEWLKNHICVLDLQYRDVIDKS